jgi:hypothetical protein
MNPTSRPTATWRSDSRAPDVAPPQAQEFVGECRSSRVGMSDAEREAAIVQAGKAIERHMAEYERTGCFGARGDADRSRRLMELLIRGRSPEYVAKLERERGLA